MARRLGPTITARDRVRIRLSQGTVRRRVSKGVFIDLDVSPLYLGAADGLGVAAAELLADATEDAPRDPATPGDRIPESGGFLVYAFGSIMETAGQRRDWKKPRTFRPTKDGLDAVVSFRSGLHHLHELGTVKMPARPYLGPARMRMAGRLTDVVSRHMPKGGPG